MSKFIEFVPQPPHQLDLYLIQYGREACQPGHSFGPAIREYYKFHYILDGKGIFEINGQRYELQKGQGFLITPDTICYYEADHNDPWTYCWIGFNGIRASNMLRQAQLSNQSPIYTWEKSLLFEQLIQQMADSKEMSAGRDLKLTGLLYLWISAMIDCRGSELKQKTKDNGIDDYITQVIHFIDVNYANKITVQSIAHYVGLQRSYLSAIFKSVMNTSLQNYLIQFRMRKACELLATTSLMVGDIARSVGYEDPLLFSKMFKKTIHISPTQYRQQQSDIEPYLVDKDNEMNS